MRILTIISGIILIIAGMWCFANAGATILPLAFVLGCAMIFFGASGVLTFMYNRKAHEVSGWILEETLITIILAILVLSNQLVTDATIPVFFGMWIMFTGVMRVVAAFELRLKSPKVWSFSLAFGVISIIGGVYAFLNPILLNLQMPVLVGLFFLIQGLNTITTGLHGMKEDLSDGQS